MPCLALPCLTLLCLGFVVSLPGIGFVCLLLRVTCRGSSEPRLVWSSLALPCFGFACCLPSLGLLWLSLACLWRGLAWLGLPYLAWPGPLPGLALSCLGPWLALFWARKSLPGRSPLTSSREAPGRRESGRSPPGTTQTTRPDKTNRTKRTKKADQRDF